MATSPAVPTDTSPEIFDLLVDGWRRLSIADRVALVDQINADVEMLARVGIRARHPDASEREICRELARRRYGNELADAAYPSNAS
jgi:hypothetical protein